MVHNFPHEFNLPPLLQVSLFALHPHFPAETEVLFALPSWKAYLQRWDKHILSLFTICFRWLRGKWLLFLGIGFNTHRVDFFPNVVDAFVVFVLSVERTVEPVGKVLEFLQILLH